MSHQLPLIANNPELYGIGQNLKVIDGVLYGQVESLYSLEKFTDLQTCIILQFYIDKFMVIHTNNKDDLGTSLISGAIQLISVDDEDKYSEYEEIVLKPPPGFQAIKLRNITGHALEETDKPAPLQYNRLVVHLFKLLNQTMPDDHEALKKIINIGINQEKIDLINQVLEH